MGFSSDLAAPSRDLLVKRSTPDNATGRVDGVVYSGLDIGQAMSPLALKSACLHNQCQPRPFWAVSTASCLSFKEKILVHPNTPSEGQFAHWVDEKAEAFKFELGEKFPVPPTELHSDSLHVETSVQKLKEVLLEHETPTPEFLAELQALNDAPPLSEEELDRQALAAGGADGDKSTPE